MLLISSASAVWCCTAPTRPGDHHRLLALMAPFKWAGAFVPLLPLNGKEIMQAPVPFVVGTTSTPTQRASPGGAVHR